MTAAEGTARDGVMAPARRATSVGLVLVITLIGFEAMAIATVMPRVSRELHGIRLYGWVFSAFMIGYAAFLIPSGWVAGRWGPRKTLTAGLIWWGAATIATALVPPGMAHALLALIAANYRFDEDWVTQSGFDQRPLQGRS